MTYITSRGIKVKKNGRGHVARCPFHADKTPSLSINPTSNLFKCFGCGAAGDVIRFVELYDKVDFKQAVKALTPFVDTTAPRPPAPVPKKIPQFSVKEKKLLAKVVAYYQRTLGEDKRGLDYLTHVRGISDPDAIKQFGAGYANGTLEEILAYDEKLIESLKKIGVLNQKGRELFNNCVVFPLVDSNKSPVGLYGRHIQDSQVSNHLYLKGPRKGLTINSFSAVKHSASVILTESIIDGLTLYDQGFKNVIPVYGVNGFIDDHLTLMQGRVKRAYIVFDADDAGQKGAKAVAARLEQKEITPFIIALPAKDVNMFFNRHTPEQFEALLKQADPDSLEQSGRISSRKQTFYKSHDYGFSVGYADRQYQIKGIARTNTQLKATVKVSKDVESNLPFELATIDFYSSRSRTWFAKMCSELFEAGVELIRDDLGKLLTLIENYTPTAKNSPAKTISKADKERALRFLKNPDLFEEILDDIKTLGVVAEQTNNLVCYLTGISRFLDKPLSVMILSRSGAGKSTVQKTVLQLMAEQGKKEYTRVSDQALFYKEEDALAHKVIAIEEEAGIGGAAYALRNIQSSGQITLAVVTKDAAGQMATKEYTVKGPVAVMLTTTSTEVDQETASRFIILSIDESEKMTSAILAKQRNEESLEGLAQKANIKAIITKHITAQSLLKPVAVVNPYGQYLSYPTRSLTARRDQQKYLGLIRTIAYLRQYQKKVQTLKSSNETVTYVEVELSDIELANRLANQVLGHSLDELSRPSRTLLDHIYAMVSALSKQQSKPLKDISFNRRMIREYCAWTDWQVRSHIKQLEELEYIHTRIGHQGKQYSYAMNYQGQNKKDEKDKCCLNLTPVEEIKKLIKIKS